MRRLFHCLITFRYEREGQSFVVRLLPVEYSHALWDSQARTAIERHGDFLRIELGQRFFDAITRSTVPLDMRVLKHVKHSPMALDLYAILVRESYLAQRIGQARFLAWRWLHERAGASYADVDNFRRKALPLIEYLLRLCPDLVVEVCRGGKGQRAGLLVSPLSDPVPRALQDRLLS